MRTGLAHRSIIMAGFAAVSAGWLLVYLFGRQEPRMFAACLFPATIMGSCIRTPGANLMLQQQEEHTGSAVALMSCFGVLMGTSGMRSSPRIGGDKVAGAGSHEHPGRTGLPGTVGALGLEAFRQADS